VEELMLRKFWRIFCKPIGAKNGVAKIALLIFATFGATDIYASVITQKKLDEIIASFAATIEEREIDSVIRQNSCAVVLIHTFNSMADEDHLIHNSSIEQRSDGHLYNHGVISGVIISEDGVVCTTADGIMNSDRIIVSVDSELRSEAEDDDLVLTEDDYVADVIRIIPELNLAFLKITPRNRKKFRFIELGNDGDLVNNDDLVMINSVVVIGKCRGQKFVTESCPCNSKNNFGLSANIVERLVYKKINGKPILLLQNNVCGTCVVPENDGGAIIDAKTGKILGIAFVNYDDFLIQKSAGIPVSVVKQGVKIAVPFILDNETITHIGVEVEDAKDKDVGAKLLDAIDVSKKPDKLGVKVTGVELDSAAEKSGVIAGDIILKFNKEIVSDTETFDNLEKHSIGMQTVTLTILRGDTIISLDINR
jgi:S1-C subfamily serine protease